MIATDMRRLAERGTRITAEIWPVDGILSHASGPTETGWRVVDGWESEEAFQRFGEVIGPVLQEVGFPGEPRTSELHNFVR